MSNYVVKNGDTFGKIAREKYGSETQTSLLVNANPGVSSPLTPGTTLIVPPFQDLPQDLPQATVATNINEVAVMINGVRFRFFDTISLTRSLDSFDTITFSAPFDTDDLTLRNTFQQLTFKNITITIGGEPFFKGTIVSIDPPLTPTSRIITVNAYSLPSVLNDSMVPASAFSLLEFSGFTLQKIASQLAGLFGISTKFTSDSGPIFERVAIKTTEKILAFLSNLARQRDFVINSTKLGQLRFEKSAVGQLPVANLSQGESPLIAVTPTFSPQNYYSHITGVCPALSGIPGSQYTIANPYLTTALRPFNFEAKDTTPADLKKAVETKMGRMFGNVATYSIDLATWRDPSGKLWKPNSNIMLIAPDAMIYSEYEFIIRSVELKKTRNAETASLKLVLPGSFSGQIPTRLPWV